MVSPRVATILVFALAAFGQAPSDLFEKAPPVVDAALRARVAKFYQAHVDGKFRVADQVVAEDSKDAFFAADKNRYRGFEITKISYTDEYTKARVVTTCDSDFLMPGKRFPVKIPMTTLWKVVDGEWFWYVEPKSEVIETPFGKMSGGKEEPAGKVSFEDRMTNPAALARQIKVDRTEVKLSSYEPASAEVSVSNQMPGEISLSLSYNGFPGFKASLDRTKLGAGQTAKILVECKPADKRPKPTLSLQLQIEQTNQVIPIRVTFAVPPEIESKLPK